MNTKQLFTVERACLVPHYQHVVVRASDAAEACRLALDEDSDEERLVDYENARPDYVDGVWTGDAAYGEDGRLRSLAVPSGLQNPERLNAERMALLLLAIGNNLNSWRLRQAPEGEDNENRDQEEADTVVETLRGLLEVAGIDEREAQVAADMDAMLFLGEGQYKRRGDCTQRDLDRARKTGSDANAGKLDRPADRFIVNGLSLTGIMALRQVVENEGEELAHRDYDNPIAADGARAIYRDALATVEALERAHGFPPREKREADAPTIIDSVAERMAERSPTGKALAQARRDAQNMAAEAQRRYEASRFSESSLELVDGRVDWLLVQLRDLAQIVDGIAAIVEESR